AAPWAGVLFVLFFCSIAVGPRILTSEWQVVSLPAADNSSAQKPGKIPPYHPIVWGHCHDSASLLLPARGLGTPVVVCHAASRLVQPRHPAPDEAIHAQHAAPPALQRAQSVCRP